MLYTSVTGRVLATGAGAALLTFGALASPASADTRQNGLVNVALTDTTVQVPVAVAANICGVGVGILSAALVQGPVDCEALGGAEATNVDNGGNDNTTQNGLVNVSATDTVVQIPVGIAANVCGVAASVLAGPHITFPVDCDAEGVAIANA
jgi:multisubunit Na+/H+ antiporter MnhB subunit